MPSAPGQEKKTKKKDGKKPKRDEAQAAPESPAGWVTLPPSADGKAAAGNNAHVRDADAKPSKSVDAAYNEEE